MHIHAKLSAQNPISDSARSQPHSHANKKSYRHFRHHTLTIASSTSNKVTFQEVQDIARSRYVLCLKENSSSSAPRHHVRTCRDLHISLKTIGPAYRIVCRDHSESGPILAVTSGFLIPFLGLMHCDMLQIFTKGKKGEEAMRTRGGILGLGLLVGGATFSYGYESGCHTAEILAINDDGRMIHCLIEKIFIKGCLGF